MAGYPDYIYRIKQAVPFTGYPLHRKENYRPFFIVGSGRSGNTLVRRILEAHSGVHIPPEVYVMGTSIQLFSRNRGLEWRTLVRLILSQIQFHPSFGSFGIPDLRPLISQLDSLPSNKRSLACILDGFYRYHAEVKGSVCIRWGDKTPNNTFCMDRILAVFPDAKFINMIRDGVDVVYSYIEAGFYQRIEDAAERWQVSLKLAEQFRKAHPGRMLDVRYEELVSSPRSSIERLCDFLELDLEPAMLESETQKDKIADVISLAHHQNLANPINTSSIGKGRQKFSQQEKKQLQNLIGKDLERLGYAPCIYTGHQVTQS